jgi:hypothetical protein
MTKAFLTAAEIKVEHSDSINIRDIRGRENFLIHGGPITYTYNLTYTSYKPVNISDFPQNISISEKEIKETKETKEAIIERKQIEHPEIKVANSILLLEI